MKQNGVDVSEYQGKIDFENVKESGIDFVMLRLGYGKYEDQKDRSFEQNYIGAKKAGLNVGAYHFSYASDKDAARREAEFVLKLLKDKQFEYPIAYNVECKNQERLGKEQLSEVVKTFCDTLREHGYYVCVYANLHFLNNCFTDEIKTTYPIWLAQWTRQPTYKGEFEMWQKSATTTVPGIYGAVDYDISYVDYHNLIRAKGLNGFQPEPQVEDYWYSLPTTFISRTLTFIKKLFKR